MLTIGPKTAARSTVETCNGVLQKRWSCLHRLKLSPERACTVIMATIVLRNNLQVYSHWWYGHWRHRKSSQSRSEKSPRSRTGWRSWATRRQQLLLATLHSVLKFWIETITLNDSGCYCHIDQCYTRGAGNCSRVILLNPTDVEFDNVQTSTPITSRWCNQGV